MLPQRLLAEELEELEQQAAEQSEKLDAAAARRRAARTLTSQFVLSYGSLAARMLHATPGLLVSMLLPG